MVFDVFVYASEEAFMCTVVVRAARLRDADCIFHNAWARTERGNNFSLIIMRSGVRTVARFAPGDSKSCRVICRGFEFSVFVESPLAVVFLACVFLSS